MNKHERVIIILDGQAGSCGKGKIAGWYAKNQHIDAAISNAMSNSGHVFVSGDEKRTFRNIPVSSVNPNIQLFLGAGSAIDLEVLAKEYESNKDILENRGDIIVHPRVPLIEQRHKDIEKSLIRSGSTFTGGGACLADKVLRNPDLKFFQEYKNIKADESYVDRINRILNDKGTILIEGSQGCDLDLNNGTDYPHVTSRQCSAAQMLADSCVPPSAVTDIIMIIRPYPIRISNKTELGININSGKYGKSNEITWQQINKDSLAYLDKDVVDFTETTTVTKKVRRVFELDIDRLKHNIKINRPTEIVLNFFQHLDSEFSRLRGNYKELYINKGAREYINWLESELNTPITILGTGEDLKDIILRPLT